MTSSPIEDEREEKDKPKSDFSIDHILNRAGQDEKKLFSDNCTNQFQISLVPFPWIHCTRYCPPKIPRNHRRDGQQKRQLGRHPRIPFTSHQLQILEDKYRQSPYLSSAEVKKISKTLQLADVRVKIWFQNRRARERREKIQTENEIVQKGKSSTQVESSIATIPSATTNEQIQNDYNLFNPYLNNI